MRASTQWPRKVAVVAQEALIEKLDALGLPPNVETKHFNAVAGSNDWAGEDVAGIIVIGRILPAPQDMEADAATLTGRPAVPCQPSRDDGNPFYDRVAGGIHLRDGSVVATEHYRHLDPTAEALRWASCESETLQAIYRIRPHRREKPFFVDIFGSTPLPLVVDEVRTWEEAIPPAFWDQADRGIILTSAVDAKAIYNLSRQKARDLTEGATMVLFPIHSTYSEKNHCGAFREVRYKRKGRQFKASVAYALPNATRDDVWTEATERGPYPRRLSRATQLRTGPMSELGEMDSFELEGEPRRSLADFAGSVTRPVIDTSGENLTLGARVGQRR